MTVDELRGFLNDLPGDMEVALKDPDTGWLLSLIYFDADQYAAKPLVILGSDYGEVIEEDFT